MDREEEAACQLASRYNLAPHVESSLLDYALAQPPTSSVLFELAFNPTLSESSQRRIVKDAAAPALIALAGNENLAPSAAADLSFLPGAVRGALAGNHHLELSMSLSAALVRVSPSLHHAFLCEVTRRGGDSSTAAVLLEEWVGTVEHLLAAVLVLGPASL